MGGAARRRRGRCTGSSETRTDQRGWWQKPVKSVRPAVLGLVLRELLAHVAVAHAVFLAGANAPAVLGPCWTRCRSIPNRAGAPGSGRPRTSACSTARRRARRRFRQQALVADVARDRWCRSCPCTCPTNIGRHRCSRRRCASTFCIARRACCSSCLPRSHTRCMHDRSRLRRTAARTVLALEHTGIGVLARQHACLAPCRSASRPRRASGWRRPRGRWRVTHAALAVGVGLAGLAAHAGFVHRVQPVRAQLGCALGVVVTGREQAGADRLRHAASLLLPGQPAISAQPHRAIHARKADMRAPTLAQRRRT